MMIGTEQRHLGRTAVQMVPGPGVLLYPDQLLLHLELLGQVGPHLLHVPLELLESLLVHLDALATVAYRGVLQEGPEHHAETECQVDIQCFHIRYFWKRTEKYKRHLFLKRVDKLSPLLLSFENRTLNFVL